jgi:hypothetical protein
MRASSIAQAYRSAQSLLGTCRDQPRAGHIGMTIGISDCRDPPRSRVSRRHVVLAIPWRDQVAQILPGAAAHAAPGFRRQFKEGDGFRHTRLQRLDQFAPEAEACAVETTSLRQSPLARRLRP